VEEIELALWVTHASGREYIASIIRSSCGVGTHRFVVPEDSSLLNDAEAGPAEHLRDVRRRTCVADRSPLMQLRQQGEELFRLVFAGENREPFRQCLNRAGEIGAWLRIKLIFHQAPAAADWPWEAMVVDWTGQFLANLPRVSIERSPGLAQSVAAPPTMRNGILRILILAASPAGLEKLDVKREKSRVAGVFRKAGIRTKVVAATTRAELDRATAVAIPFDIVHVICHGDFEENQGVLVLEGEREDGSRLVSPELTALLRRPAALVFLNACHSARRARDPFASFADSLLRAGTSAVIGMRRPIAEEAAQIIAPEFYQHLAAGEKVGRALAKWRELSPREDAHWAVPVLYLGCEDFALLAPRSAVPPAAPEEMPRRRPWVLVAAVAALAAIALTVVLLPGESSDPRCPSPRGLDLPMVFIAAGSFDMGSDREKEERPVHQVAITRSFCLAATETTTEQYAKAQGAAAPTQDGRLPKGDLEFKDAQFFVEALAKREPEANFRLPTEAQWEYAARAGLQGDDTETAPTDANCDGTALLPVRRFAPNRWGLYDMRGNAWEWVADWAGDYPAGPVEDPAGPATGEKRIRRGGSFASSLKNCRVSNRSIVLPDHKHDGTGFRIARDPVP
jgi:formylglycine-generating enzyme